ncbi:small cysteine-rich protein 2-like [Oculina patagonica]
MDSKFHLCLLLIILGSLTMQVHSQQGACEPNFGRCSDQDVECNDCSDHFYCPGFQKCCCYFN